MGERRRVSKTEKRIWEKKEKNDQNKNNWKQKITYLACNAPLLTSGVPSEHVLTAEAWWQRTLLHWVVNCCLFIKKGFRADPQTTNKFPQENNSVKTLQLRRERVIFWCCISTGRRAVKCGDRTEEWPHDTACSHSGSNWSQHLTWVSVRVIKRVWSRWQKSTIPSQFSITNY